MPTIIIEGIDGAGKSTFIEKIDKAITESQEWYDKKWDKVFYHRGVPVGTIEQEYMNPLLRAKKNEFFVADRWHVGEMIYGPIYRGETLVSGQWEADIEQQLDRMNAIKIILLPPLEVVKKRLATRGEDYLQDEHIDDVYHFYSEYAEKWNYTVFRWEDLSQTLADNVVSQAYHKAVAK